MKGNIVNGADIVIIALIAAVLVVVVLKTMVFKGPKWKRDMERASRASKTEER